MSELNKLRWRCRRGTLELDRLLIGYLESRYLAADDLEKLAFLRLLGLEDSELMHYLMGETAPENPDLRGVVAAIRVLPVAAGPYEVE